MFNGLTKLQQKVATNRLSGMSAFDAYVNGGGKARNSAVAATCAHEILNNPNVSSFIKSFEVSAEERIVAAVMSRDEMLERLSEMARIELSLSDISKPENIKHVSEVIIGPEGPVYKMKASADRRAAMKLLADLQGYAKPQEINVTVTKKLGDFYKE